MNADQEQFLTVSYLKVTLEEITLSVSFCSVYRKRSQRRLSKLTQRRANEDLGKTDLSFGLETILHLKAFPSLAHTPIDSPVDHFQVCAPCQKLSSCSPHSFLLLLQPPHVDMGSNLHGEIRVTESVCDYTGTEPGVEVRSIWCSSSSLAIRFVFGIKEVVTEFG